MMTFEPPSKHVLTTTEVTEWLGYSNEQIRTLCEKGAFEGNDDLAIQGAYRASGNGSAWRIPRAAVVYFLEQRKSKVQRRAPKGSG